MRSRKVTRYLCDFCNKGMFKKPSMEKHEKVCFQNPVRQCWGCGYDGGISTQPMPELIAVLEAEGLEGLRRVTSGCPACIVSAMIQQRKDDPLGERLTYPDENLSLFNYKDEMDRFCREVRESRPEDFM